LSGIPVCWDHPLFAVSHSIRSKSKVLSLRAPVWFLTKPLRQSKWSLLHSPFQESDCKLVNDLRSKYCAYAKVGHPPSVRSDIDRMFSWRPIQ
jgi:hypothetical protein